MRVQDQGSSGLPLGFVRGIRLSGACSLEGSFSTFTGFLSVGHACHGSGNWAPASRGLAIQRAQWAGYQLKRGAAKPLLHIEMEPGQAIEAALHVIHPFTLAAPLSAPEEKALRELQRPAHEVVQHRGHLLRCWSQIAIDLLPQSVQAIRQLPDAP